MRSARVTLAGCAAIIAYMLTYVGVDYGKWPRLTYDPLRRAWTFGVPSGVASGYVGQWLWALAAGIAAGGCAYALAGLRRRPASERTLGFLLAWALTAVGIAVAYFTWMNWP